MFIEGKTGPGSLPIGLINALLPIQWLYIMSSKENGPSGK